jgi:hypothetical protein
MLTMPQTGEVFTIAEKRAGRRVKGMRGLQLLFRQKRVKSGKK